MAHPSATPRQVRERPDAVAWPSYGVAAGVLGAAIVALLLLIVDSLHGRPLWTPAALGSRLLLGNPLEIGPRGFEPWSKLHLVVFYTAVHLALYVGYGSIAAFFAMTAERTRSAPLVAAVIALALFATFEVTFACFAALFGWALLDDLASGWIAAANACAALAMGIFLGRFSGHRAPRTSEDLPKP